MEIQLQNITINEYSKLLRTGVKKELIKAIDTDLSKLINGVGTGFDLAIFMMQKDLLIFQCKAARAYLERDNVAFEKFNKKAFEISEELKKKTNKKEKADPYKIFLAWILSVEKFLGFAIDKNNDLLYFVEATKQMLHYYDEQKRQLEKK
jgi:hypothetical protein